MKSLVVALMFAVQVPGPRIPLTAFVGTWVSATPSTLLGPPKLWPSYSVQLKDNKVLVTLAGMKEVLVATTFSPIQSSDVSALLIRRQAAPGKNQTIFIRPAPGGQMQCEMFAEYLAEFVDTAKGGAGNFYFTDTYSKSK